MRRLLKGDIRRILRKNIFAIFFVLMLLLDVGVCCFTYFRRLHTGFAFVSDQVMVFPLIFFVFSLVVFLGVYADEFKSMTMIGVIGRGFSREKMVIVKFIDSLLLLILQTGGFALVLFIGIKLSPLSLSPEEMKFLFVKIAIETFLALGYMTMAAFMFYLTNNTAVAVFSLIGLTFLVGFGLKIANISPVLRILHLDRYYLSGLAGSAFSDIIIGNGAAAAGIMLAAGVIYIGGALLITTLYFSKKELDF